MTLIETAKLNGVDPMTWLTDVLERIVSGRTKAHELHTLLPWNWRDKSTLAHSSQTRRWPHDPVIDHPDQVGRLMERVSAALPIRHA